MSRGSAFHRSVLIFFVMWSGSSGAQTDDNLLRAAYCAGVFYAGPKQTEDQLAAECQRADPGVWSIKECKSAMSKFATGTHQTWEEWQRRYDRYSALLRAVPAERARSLSAVIQKGVGDAFAKAAKPATISKCFETSCLLASAQRASCIVECVAQDDRVHADVLRCQLMPDADPVFPPAD